MRKISFEEAKENKNLSLYLLRTKVPTMLEKVPCEESYFGYIFADGYELIDDYDTVAKDGKVIAAAYAAKGELTSFTDKEGNRYLVEEDIGPDEALEVENDEGVVEFIYSEEGFWWERKSYYDKGCVVVLDNPSEIKDYIFDGWCNLYPKE